MLKLRDGSTHCRLVEHGMRSWITCKGRGVRTPCCMKQDKSSMKSGFKCRERDTRTDCGSDMGKDELSSGSGCEERDGRTPFFDARKGMDAPTTFKIPIDENTLDEVEDLERGKVFRYSKVTGTLSLCQRPVYMVGAGPRCKLLTARRCHVYIWVSVCAPGMCVLVNHFRTEL